jgi:hypothetical protein
VGGTIDAAAPPFRFSSRGIVLLAEYWSCSLPSDWTPSAAATQVETNVARGLAVMAPAWAMRGPSSVTTCLVASDRRVRGSRHAGPAMYPRERPDHPGAGRQRAMRTGHSLRCRTLCATLPSSRAARSEWPREPITIRPAPCSLAASRMRRAAEPYMVWRRSTRARSPAASNGGLLSRGPASAALPIVLSAAGARRRPWLPAPSLSLSRLVRWRPGARLGVRRLTCHDRIHTLCLSTRCPGRKAERGPRWRQSRSRSR